MGMDVFGLKPKMNTEMPKVLKDMPEGKDWLDAYNKMSKKQKEIYYKAKNKHYEDNPGVYFRNNVWYWRPLWDYVCKNVTSLTEEDHTNGHSNSGWQISETKAITIAGVLYAMLESGAVKEAERLHFDESKAQAEADPDDNFPTYPFSEENVREFAIFCEESGGFEIC
tara:strand:+ start:409 stop:912 length:504 start_codon:yes stop_codon:yes gene_type:complete